MKPSESDKPLFKLPETLVAIQADIAGKNVVAIKNKIVKLPTSDRLLLMTAINSDENTKVALNNLFVEQDDGTFVPQATFLKVLVEELNIELDQKKAKEIELQRKAARVGRSNSAPNTRSGSPNPPPALERSYSERNLKPEANAGAVKLGPPTDSSLLFKSFVGSTDSGFSTSSGDPVDSGSVQIVRRDYTKTAKERLGIITEALASTNELLSTRITKIKEALMVNGSTTLLYPLIKRIDSDVSMKTALDNMIEKQLVIEKYLGHKTTSASFLKALLVVLRKGILLQKNKSAVSPIKQATPGSPLANQENNNLLDQSKNISEVNGGLNAVPKEPDDEELPSNAAANKKHILSGQESALLKLKNAQKAQSFNLSTPAAAPTYAVLEGSTSANNLSQDANLNTVPRDSGINPIVVESEYIVEESNSSTFKNGSGPSSPIAIAELSSNPFDNDSFPSHPAYPDADALNPSENYIDIVREAVNNYNETTLETSSSLLNSLSIAISDKDTLNIIIADENLLYNLRNIMESELKAYPALALKYGGLLETVTIKQTSSIDILDSANSKASSAPPISAQLSKEALVASLISNVKTAIDSYIETAAPNNNLDNTSKDNTSKESEYLLNTMDLLALNKEALSAIIADQSLISDLKTIVLGEATKKESQFTTRYKALLILLAREQAPLVSQKPATEDRKQDRKRSFFGKIADGLRNAFRGNQVAPQVTTTPDLARNKERGFLRIVADGLRKAFGGKNQADSITPAPAVLTPEEKKRASLILIMEIAAQNLNVIPKDLLEEGVFRLTMNISKRNKIFDSKDPQKEFKASASQEKLTSIELADIIKTAFKALVPSVPSFDIQTRLAALQITDSKLTDSKNPNNEKVKAILDSMPKEDKGILDILTDSMLYCKSAESNITKMAISNLAIVLSPNISKDLEVSNENSTKFTNIATAILNVRELENSKKTPSTSPTTTTQSQLSDEKYKARSV